MLTAITIWFFLYNLKTKQLVENYLFVQILMRSTVDSLA